MTAEGTATARTTRRLEPKDRIDQKLFGSAKGVPWDPHGGVHPGRGRPKRAQVLPIPAAVGAEHAEAGVGPDEATRPEEAAAEGDGDRAEPRDAPRDEAEEVVTPRGDADVAMTVGGGDPAERMRGPKRPQGEDDGELGGSTGDEPPATRQRVAAVMSSDGDLDDKALELLQAPPSDYPMAEEHPEEVGAATELALGRLKVNSVYGDVTASFARQHLKPITARWERKWVWNSSFQSWDVKARYVAREFRSMGFRDDFFAPSATHTYGRIVDYVAVKEDRMTFEIDAQDAHYHAEEHEPMCVDAPEEYN